MTEHTSVCKTCGAEFHTLHAQTLTREGEFIGDIYVLTNYTVRCPQCGGVVKVTWQTPD